MKNYDKCLIITLSEKSKNFERYCLKKYKQTEVIYIKFDKAGKMQELAQVDQEKISSLTGGSHLYILGYHLANYPHLIFESENKFLTYQQVGSLIADHVIRENISGLRISLQVCHAAKSYNLQIDQTLITLPLSKTKFSLAGLLLDYFIQRGLDQIELIAHKQITCTMSNFWGTYKFAGDKQVAAFNEIIAPLYEPYLNGSASQVPIETLAELLVTTETAMTLLKKSSRQLSNEKMLFYAESKAPKKIDYYKVKAWAKKVTEDFNKAGIDCEEFKKRTYPDQLNLLGFFKSNSTCKEQADLAEKALDTAKEIETRKSSTPL